MILSIIFMTWAPRQRMFESYAAFYYFPRCRRAFRANFARQCSLCSPDDDTTAALINALQSLAQIAYAAVLSIVCSIFSIEMRLLFTFFNGDVGLRFRNFFVSLPRNQFISDMTLQQMEYVLAVYKYRHFMKAAESCGVTQSTLSSMIRKLEDELDTVIFDRNSHPVRPTRAGEAVIRQAQVVVYNARQLKELTLNERKRLVGDVRIGISPTIAAYVVPKMFSFLHQYFPNLNLMPVEIHRNAMVERLQCAEIDMAIMSMPEKEDGLLEIPLYQEHFVAYVSPTDPLYKEDEVDFHAMPSERLWALKDEVCFRRQVDIPDMDMDFSVSAYESGSLVTLIQIVDENGGFTILPELHLPLLSIPRRAHVRPLVNPSPIRQVSLFVRRDYVREAVLNAIADAVKSIIPSKMIDERLSKFPIRL